METKPKTISEKIADAKAQIISNSKDAKWAKTTLDKLISLQKQDDIEPVEMIVPTKEVKETIDSGSVRISRTIRGFLFEAKGGMYTFVDNRMVAVCAMLHTLFELHNKERNEEEESLYFSFQNAVSYIFQTPIFASLDEKMLFRTAADILKNFREYIEIKENTAPHEETEKDIESNNVAEQYADALEELKNVPTPPDI